MNKIFQILMVGFVAIFMFCVVVLVALYSLYLYSQRPNTKDQADMKFVNECQGLNGEPYTTRLIEQIHGYCFEPCELETGLAGSCSHAVACRVDHVKEATKSGMLTVTVEPGAPEGWYCRLSIGQDGVITSKSEYVTD